MAVVDMCSTFVYLHVFVYGTFIVVLCRFWW